MASISITIEAEDLGVLAALPEAPAAAAAEAAKVLEAKPVNVKESGR